VAAKPVANSDPPAPDAVTAPLAQAQAGAVAGFCVKSACAKGAAQSKVAAVAIAPQRGRQFEMSKRMAMSFGGGWLVRG
jgi:hypothetical protein